MESIQKKLAELREQFAKADYLVRGYMADTKCGVGTATTCSDFNDMQKELTLLLNMVVSLKIDLRLVHETWQCEVNTERMYGK